jgi:hypothetical protein
MRQKVVAGFSGFLDWTVRRDRLPCRAGARRGRKPGNGQRFENQRTLSNADEYLNNDMKGNVKAEGLPDNKEDLRSLIQAFMRKLLLLPQHVMSYFQHPCVQYTAGPEL